MTPELVRFGDLPLHVVPDAGHAWVMATKEVARGYGVTEDAIRKVKSRHAGELLEGKHFLPVRFPTPSGAKTMTCWSQHGVIRLGFLGLKGERAAKFRDWAEELVLQAAVTNRHSSPEVPKILGILERMERVMDAMEHRLRALEGRNPSPSPTLAAHGGRLAAASAGDPFQQGDPWFAVHELVQRAAQAIAAVTGEPVSVTAMKLWSETKKRAGWSRMALRAIPLNQLPLMRAEVQRVVLRAKEDWPDLDLGTVGLGTLN